MRINKMITKVKMFRFLIKFSERSLVPRRSLLPRCPRKVWEYLFVTSQPTVESRNDRAENAQGLGY